MRSAVVLAALVTSLACPRAGAPPSATTIRELAAGPSATGLVRRFEIVPHAGAKLLVAFGDRVTELDLTPTEADPKQADALLALAPVKKGTPLVVELRARPWRGDDVLASFVAPLSEDAAKGAMSADPEFHKRKMIAVELTIGSQNVGRTIVFAGGAALGASVDARVDGVLAVGAPLIVQQWVMAEPSGFVPNTHVDGTRLVARSDAKGADVPASELPAALWTLWLQLEP
jgi:hypothetical protein